MAVVGPDLLGVAGFGRRLFRARTEKGLVDGRTLSKAEVGRQVAVSDVAVGQWERGDSTPSVETIQTLAAYLGVRAGWLAFGENPRYQHGDIAEPIEGVPQVSSVKALDAAEREIAALEQDRRLPRASGAGPVDRATGAQGPSRRPGASQGKRRKR